MAASILSNELQFREQLLPLSLFKFVQDYIWLYVHIPDGYTLLRTDLRIKTTTNKLSLYAMSMNFHANVTQVK